MSSDVQHGHAADGNPHHAAIGGAAAVARLVSCFYEAMDTLPEAASIRALHPSDLTPVKEVLTRYLAEWLGGPAAYSAERGHPRLRRRHLPFRPPHANLWVIHGGSGRSPSL